LIESMDCCIAIAVRDENLAIVSDGDIRWMTERGLEGWSVTLAKPHRDLAIAADPHDLMRVAIAQPHGPVPGREQAVRITREPPPPGAEQVACRAEGHQGVLAPMPDVNPVLRVHGNRADDPQVRARTRGPRVVALEHDVPAADARTRHDQPPIPAKR